MHLREGLRKLLDSDDDITIVVRLQWNDCIKMLTKLKPDILRSTCACR